MRARSRNGSGWSVAFMSLAVVLAACSPADDGGDGGGASEPATAAYPEEDIQIMAPADPGGGWDSTARAMQPVLEEVSGVGVEVYNVPGAGGTIGLAQLADENAGDPYQIMVMGLVMVGAIITNDSAVTLDQVTPIASLTSEQEAIVVPADSEYQTLEDLVAAWSEDPAAIAWGGGSAGGTDHILVGLLAQEAGVDPSGINYVPHSGGGEALTDLLNRATPVAVSGVSEFADAVDAGDLRFLAVSGESAPEGIEAPTISESGYDVVLENWRGVMAPADISDADREAIIAVITEMHDSEAWQTALADNGWTDFFQTGDDFATYLGEEQTRVEAVLAEIDI